MSETPHGSSLARSGRAVAHTALREGRRYRTALEVEAFARMLEQHPRVALLPGEPSRQEQQRAGAEITAWRRGPHEFVLAPQPPGRHELEPPALHLRFEDDGTLHMRASLSLAAEFDAALRTWVDRVGMVVAGGMFFAGTYAGSVALVAVLLDFLLPLLGLSQGRVFMIAAWLALLPAWWSMRLLGVFRFERAKQRAWRLALPPLHDVAGELVTPHTLGSADADEPLPYREARR